MVKLWLLRSPVALDEEIEKRATGWESLPLCEQCGAKPGSACRSGKPHKKRVMERIRSKRRADELE